MPADEQAQACDQVTLGVGCASAAVIDRLGCSPGQKFRQWRALLADAYASERMTPSDRSQAGRP